ncbi:hypothetical protein FNH22_20390 [Fulvivirga sp. M361]|uniref:hypothetical protein n=1 Tax=Fulvivirga sp. M361 TaxID=2594266 RepID=UPI00117BB473|nr:hypothetical protein [Fulvivirga sp. M361]TRX53716.1 hypothetical protein FNH22_20390 [Fulvivirga sp. M361]
MDKAWISVVLAGLFSGLAFLTHLNAVVFAVSAFLFLVFYREWRGMFVFSMITVPICLIYSDGLWSNEAIETYMFQLRNWPTHQSTFGEKIDGGGILGTIGNNLLRLAGEHKRYFWDHDVWGISGLFLFSLIARFKYLKKQCPYLLTYTLILMLVLGVLSSSHSPRYLTYLMPFMIVIISMVIVSLKLETRKGFKVFFLVGVTAQLVFASISFVTVFKRNRDHVLMHSEALSAIEKGTKVLGPWGMIYNNIDDYHIFSYKTYEYIEDMENRKLTQQELLQLAAERFDIDYIVIDHQRKIDKEFKWFRDWEIEENDYFEAYKAIEDYLVLKRKQSI